MASAIPFHLNVIGEGKVSLSVGATSCGAACSHDGGGVSIVKVRDADVSAGHVAPSRVTTNQVVVPLGSVSVAVVAGVDTASAGAAVPVAVQSSYAVAPETPDHEKDTGFATFVAPFAGAISDEGAVGHTGAGAVITVVADAELLLLFGSDVDAVTLAVAVTVAGDTGAVTLIVNVAVADGARDAALHVTVDVVFVQVMVPDVLMTESDGSSETESDTDCAVEGPIFVTPTM